MMHNPQGSGGHALNASLATGRINHKPRNKKFNPLSVNGELVEEHLRRNPDCLIHISLYMLDVLQSLKLREH